MTDELRIKAPDVAAAFERARKGLEEETERPELHLEYTPPAPAPGGTMERRRPLVSPQLREEDPKAAQIRAHVASMLARREFNRAARDAWER